MKHTLRKVALRLVVDSPLEHLSRRIYTQISSTKGATYDRQMFQIMQHVLKKQSNCIDVGSYRGEVLRNIIKLAPQGVHFAFEPILINYQYLVRKFSSVTLFNIALSDFTGKANFQYVVSRPARSGLRKVEYPDENEKINEIIVDIDTLDNVINSTIPIDFIKIDVEGSELSVLRGGQHLIKKYHPVIVFEYGAWRAQHYGTTSSQIYAFLTEECGLSVSLMARWLKGQQHLSEAEFHHLTYERREFCFIAYAPGAHA
jgi:FkbM family methyltransferase